LHTDASDTAMLENTTANRIHLIVVRVERLHMFECFPWHAGAPQAQPQAATIPTRPHWRDFDTVFAELEAQQTALRVPVPDDAQDDERYNVTMRRTSNPFVSLLAFAV
jgi:hypothetical protein